MRRNASSRPAARRLGLGVVTALAAAVAAPALLLLPADAATNPYQLGPDPTTASVAASNGPFATAQMTVPAGNGFNGGYIYYPTDTSHTYGGVAIVPGYTAKFANEEAWMGPRLASFGFVVIGIETNSTNDFDTARGTQLLAALDYLTKSSQVKSRVDPNRLAVVGHSMGGGGALSAATNRSSLKAAVGLAPYHPSGNMSKITVPTLVIAGQNDTVVTPSYLDGLVPTLPASTPGAFVQIQGVDHLFATKPNTVEMRTLIPWLKIFVDNDTRYTQFFCPSLKDTSGVSRSSAKCSTIPQPTTTEATSSPQPSTSSSPGTSATPSATPTRSVGNAIDANYQVTREGAYNNSKYTVFRPSNPAAISTPLPVVAFGNGACAHTDNNEVTRILTFIASRGFVVVDTGSANGSNNGVASGNPIPSLLTGAMDWAKSENGRSGAALAGHLDLDRIATAGHSCGGLEALVAGADSRVKAVVSLDSGLFADGSFGYSRNELNKLHSPVLFMDGGSSDQAFDNSRANYDLVKVPAILAEHSQAGHVGFITGQQINDGMTVVVQFLDLALNGNATAKSWLLGSGGLSSKQFWSVRSKNF